MNDDILKSLRLIESANAKDLKDLTPLTESADYESNSIDAFAKEIASLLKAEYGDQGVDDVSFNDAYDFQEFILDALGSDWEDAFGSLDDSHKMQVIKKVKMYLGGTASGNDRDDRGTLRGSVREEELSEVSDEKVYKHKGNYGTSYDGDADEKKAAEPAVKRGRGRPKKDADNSGEVKKYDWSAFGGKVKLPPHKGTVTKHRVDDPKPKAKVDEADMEEGNQFSGALAKAKAAGAKDFEVDGKKYQVNEVSDEKVYKHKGSYGTSYDGNDDEKAPEVKRGRGRPRKGADNSGEVKKYDFSAFTKKAPVGKHTGAITKHKMVGESVDGVIGAITNRIMRQRVDLLSQYGPEAVMAAIEDVAQSYGDLEELGSSDISGMVKSVEASLGYQGGEQVNELSKDTLGSYAKKASRDAKRKGFEAGLETGGNSAWMKTSAKGDKRVAGIGKAVDRMTNESVVLQRALELIKEAIVLEKKMTAKDKAKREEIAKSMKKDKKVFEQRYGNKAEQVMYATATKQAMKEAADPVLYVAESAFRKIAALFESVDMLSPDTQDALYDGSLDLEDAIQNGTGLRAGEQQALKDMYNNIANANGLDPDADYEEIYDQMMGEIESAVVNGDINEAKADPVGSWVAHKDDKAKKFKTREGAKAYCDKHEGYKVASAEGFEKSKKVDEGADLLNKRTGMSRINKTPRDGQTDMSNIPAGNLPGSKNRFTQRDRDEQPNRLKTSIKSSLGKHGPVGVLPEGAKPDFLDADKDGDKKEPMKKAITDKKKMVKENLDMGVGVQSPMMGTPAEPEKIDLSANMLIDLLKLAGLGGNMMTPYAPAAPAPVAVAPAMPEPEMSAELPDEIPMDEEEYANSPDEEYGELDDIITNGDDLHKEKGTYPKVAGGDNPRQSSVFEGLWAQYQAAKAKVK